MLAFHRRRHQLDGSAGFGPSGLLTFHNRKEKRHAAYGLTKKNAAYGWIIDIWYQEFRIWAPLLKIICHVRLTGKSADDNPDLLREKNTIISLKRYRI